MNFREKITYHFTWCLSILSTQRKAFFSGRGNIKVPLYFRCSMEAPLTSTLSNSLHGTRPTDTSLIRSFNWQPFEGSNVRRTDVINKYRSGLFNTCHVSSGKQCPTLLLLTPLYSVWTWSTFVRQWGKSWLLIVYDRGVCQLEMAYEVLKLKQHGRYFVDIFKCITLNAKFCILIRYSVEVSFWRYNW